jgi:hypothetical protein
MRPLLRSLASVWLACQLAGFAAAPLAVCLGPAAPAVADVEDACCPGIAPGQMCPMHHTREGTRHCVLRNACASSSAALLTLFGGLGLMPPSAESLTVFAVSPLASAPSSERIVRADLPESPPPRA